jgi:hypothetical protein
MRAFSLARQVPAPFAVLARAQTRAPACAALPAACRAAAASFVARASAAGGRAMLFSSASAAATSAPAPAAAPAHRPRATRFVASARFVATRIDTGRFLRRAVAQW